MTTVSDRPHALYRFYDNDRQLLYVGITSNPGARWKKHANDKPWWGDVARVELEHYPTRDAVLAAERDAIISERPQRNVVHNRPGTGSAPEHAGVPASLVDLRGEVA